MTITPEHLSIKRLVEVERRLEGVEAEPDWRFPAKPPFSTVVYVRDEEARGEFLQHSRDDVRALLGHIAALEQLIAEMTFESTLAAMEESDG